MRLDFRLIAFIMFFQFWNATAWCQAHLGQESNSMEDSTTILFALKHGRYEGHFRYYFSATDNSRPLTDYFANAAGGGLRYESGKYRGLQLCLSGFYIFNLYSSDLSKPDPNTNAYNRYEIGLFDVEDPLNKKDIDRLEELYLQYSWKRGVIKFGRQLIDTPFINLQDGRMRATGVEGLWLKGGFSKNWKMEGGWIYAISPRSTVQWYRAAHSVGIYPSGVQTNGLKSNYAGRLTSLGVGLGHLQYSGNTKWTVTLWDCFFEGIMNTTMVQAEYQDKKEGRKEWLMGIQGIMQRAINNGYRQDDANRYIDNQARSYSFGAHLERCFGPHNLSVNYNRITRHGRYLMPREWGREPFYTFIPRERNEGAGDVNAMTIVYSLHAPTSKWRATVATGLYLMPDVLHYKLNKYGMPSYLQANLDVHYKLSKGMDVQFLIAHKWKMASTHGSLNHIFNKVNMSLLNVVLNYHF
jgi:hypothetical protein